MGAAERPNSNATYARHRPKSRVFAAGSSTRGSTCTLQGGVPQYTRSHTPTCQTWRGEFILTKNAEVLAAPLRGHNGFCVGARGEAQHVHVHKHAVLQRAPRPAAIAAHRLVTALQPASARGGGSGIELHTCIGSTHGKDGAAAKLSRHARP